MVHPVRVTDFPTRRARPRRRLLAVLAVTVILALGLGLVGYYAAYRVFPWSSYPSRLHVCNRDFQTTSAPQTRAAITQQGYHLVRDGDLPGWLNNQQLWSFNSVNGQAAEALPGGCHVVMWMRGGPDSYKSYELEGGP